MSSSTTTTNNNHKSVLHLAAWHGSIETVRWLLEWGCDVDTISTGPYSYGKTAIFFATTRGRNDVVQLLLEYGANVCIINNKGQSVLSLASTHLPPTTIAAIQKAEKEQQTAAATAAAAAVVNGHYPVETTPTLLHPVID